MLRLMVCLVEMVFIKIAREDTVRRASSSMVQRTIEEALEAINDDDSD
jgi:hypothetical protein